MARMMGIKSRNHQKKKPDDNDDEKKIISTNLTNCAPGIIKV